LPPTKVLAGWWYTYPFWKIWVRQWVSDDNPYMKWKIKNAPNHQPVGIFSLVELANGCEQCHHRVNRNLEQNHISLLPWKIEDISSNVGKTIINHPPISTILIGGINHSQMGGWLLFYPH
jgi:hypothetical protein